MSAAPTSPKIYHITHLDNLPQIVGARFLLSDAERLLRKMDCHLIGMPSIKMRRLMALDVRCHPGTKVGQYVPFYFCPRSIMLYLLYRGNHPDIEYRGGQRPIVHLVADLRRSVEWAEAGNRRWAFTDCNAGAGYAGFFSALERLDRVNWAAVSADDWRDPTVKDGKQAEFLMHEAFPWELIERIGVVDAEARERAEVALRSAAHKPVVTVERGWYY
jgi:hypothetical protein